MADQVYSPKTRNTVGTEEEIIHSTISLSKNTGKTRKRSRVGRRSGKPEEDSGE